MDTRNYSLKQIIESVCSDTLRQLITESSEEKSIDIKDIIPIILQNDAKILDDVKKYDNDGLESIMIAVDKKINGDKLDNIFNAFKQGNWTCTHGGGYYDDSRLRVHLENAAKLFNTNEYGVRVYMFEPLYDEEMTHDTIKNHVKEKDYDNRFMLRQGIFYHVTNRGNVANILKKGLIAANGNAITRFRNTNNRVYLSYIPDLREDYTSFDEEDMEESVILKVDLNKLNKPLKLYLDREYPNAVYTTENIPPKCISVMNGENVDMFKRVLYFYKRYLKETSQMYGSINMKPSSLVGHIQTNKNLYKETFDYLKNVMLKNFSSNRFSFKDLDKVIKYTIENYKP